MIRNSITLTEDFGERIRQSCAQGQTTDNGVAFDQDDRGRYFLLREAFHTDEEIRHARHWLRLHRKAGSIVVLTLTS